MKFGGGVLPIIRKGGKALNLSPRLPKGGLKMAVSKIPLYKPIFFGSGTELTNLNDLNDVTAIGLYYHTSETASPANSPTNATKVFSMQVLPKSGGPVQVLFDNNSDMYFRIKTSTAWQTWKKVTTTNA